MSGGHGRLARARSTAQTEGLLESTRFRGRGMKRELDLDGTLKDWQAPARADAAWEEQAEAILSKAKPSSKDDGRALDALFAAPDLAPEPGEPVNHGAAS